MSKLLSTSLLAVGVMCAMSASAANSLLIQNPGEAIQLTYGLEGSPGTSNSYTNVVISVGAVDANGELIGDWQQAFWSKNPGTAGATSAVYGDYNSLPGMNVVEFTPGEGAVELVFKWQIKDFVNNPSYNVAHTRYSDGFNPINPAVWNSATNSAGGALIGFADGLDQTSFGFFITASNVMASNAPAIPEPETYAMMLAGLGMVGAVVRRRRKTVQ